MKKILHKVLLLLIAIIIASITYYIYTLNKPKPLFLKEITLNANDASILATLSPDELIINDICQNFINAYINKDLKVMESYLANPSEHELPLIRYIPSTVILRWDDSMISPEEAYVNSEFRYAHQDFYVYLEIYLSKISNEWKITLFQFQP